MPELSVTRTLQECVNEVLEKMFFIDCSGEQGGELSPEAGITVRLEFEGDPPGVLFLRVTAEAARDVAGGFLGIDDKDLSEPQIGAVVCELANMICGSVLSRIESSATFRLGAPHIVSSESDSGEPGRRVQGAVPDPAACSAAYAAMVGEGRLVVRLDLEKPAWNASARSAF
ncbi:MAG TPA: chemotaxis protein CheX [Bryobacteraceae bacterium]|nr:chemotaxis protein CheX [Bryobacteraceae bacterium]